MKNLLKALVLSLILIPAVQAGSDIYKCTKCGGGNKTMTKTTKKVSPAMSRREMKQICKGRCQDDSACYKQCMRDMKKQNKREKSSIESTEVSNDGRTKKTYKEQTKHKDGRTQKSTSKRTKTKNMHGDVVREDYVEIMATQEDVQ